MDIRTIREARRRPAPDGPDILVHPDWIRSWTWLVQGTTTRDRDFALGGRNTTEAWAELTAAVGCRAAAHARQPHGAGVGVRTPDAPGLHVFGDADGHLTRAAGVLLGVTTADCVPVTLVAPGTGTRPPAVGMIHAGWRGAAAGILRRGLDRMSSAFAVSSREVHVHLGPSICGECYEVGPEVHEALGLDRPSGPEPIDLADRLAHGAVTAGVEPDHVTRSAWCTRCDGHEFLHSHRAGDTGRQIGFVAIADGRAGAARPGTGAAAP